MVTIDKFMNFFGVIFVVSTTIVMLLKKETNNSAESLEDDLSIKDTYKIMWRVLKLKPVIKLNIILLTAKIGFAIESMSIIKLIEAGVPKENLSMLAVPLTPLQIILPLMISKYTNGPRPLDFFVKSIPFRLGMGVIAAVWIYFTPHFHENNLFPAYYYAICLLINFVHSIFMYSMFVSQMSFFAQISDKTIGGTYMTFLNTITNFGGTWPSTAALFLAGYITVRKCTTIQNGEALVISNNTCTNDLDIKTCTSMSGLCSTTVDAYYVLAAGCTIFGLFWFIWAKNVVFKLQSLPKAAWKIKIRAV
jgi:PAT family acetyl-CoA transporter-like MFS transporter 1